MFAKLSNRLKQWRAKRRTSPTKNESAQRNVGDKEIPTPCLTLTVPISRPTRLGGLPISSDGIAQELPPRVQFLLDKNRPIDLDDDEKFDFELALKAMKMIDRLNNNEPLSPESVLLTPMAQLSMKNDSKARTPSEIQKPHE